MSPARFLSPGIIGLATAVLLLAAPVPATADVVPTTLNEVAMSARTLQATLERDKDRGDRDAKKSPTVAEVYAQFQDARSNRLRALGYFGDVKGREHVLPVPPFSYHLTAGFGAFGAMWGSSHTGLDFAAPLGTQVVAVADGTITDVLLDPSYGLLTVLTLEDGTEVWYAHQGTSSVMPGQTVEIGHLVGTVGSSGNSSGPHLHLEVRPAGGASIDPNLWLIDRGLTP
ncbi:MAG: peptidase [Nocardioides sp.]|uniref:M23 family metallopeptidase n=1 Tax=Nocardioides sp. TaxID=35761 RepID=UPI002634158A|nr:M23 family metallopeptidase [Nocardioides sp.]MCW2834246.1 peptidase [Nocardioides sp.]